MGKITYFVISYMQHNGVVSAGTALRGTVKLTLEAPMKLNHLKVVAFGRAKNMWTTGGKHKTTHRDEEVYVNEGAFLVGSEHSKDMSIDAGTHVYDFNIPIPVTAPSSFEGTRVGYVRYYCIATISRPWKFDHDTKTAFTVVSILDLNNEPGNLYSPVEGNNTTEAKCCCCIKFGSVTATFRINKTGFVPGESIIMNATVTNNSSQSIKSTKVVLVQNTNFMVRKSSFTGKEYIISREVVENMAEVDREGIGPGNSQVWDNVALQIPPVPPSRLVGCTITDIMYIVKFYVKCMSTIKIASEITIGTIPLRPQNMAPVIQQPGIEPSAPSSSNYDPSLPPPDYRECFKGHRSISEEGDSQYMHGETNWAPSYPTYNFPPLSETQHETHNNWC